VIDRPDLNELRGKNNRGRLGVFKEAVEKFLECSLPCWLQISFKRDFEVVVQKIMLTCTEWDSGEVAEKGFWDSTKTLSSEEM